MDLTITVNNQTHHLSADGEKPLLWFLREDLGLTGTKFGCGIAACGACTVHVDGEATRSCSVSVDSVAGKHITTIEGLAPPGSQHTLQAAWIAHQVPQCGYCQSGMLMAVAALLKKTPAPSEADIDSELTNICRCGTYVRIKEAILDATKTGAVA